MGGGREPSVKADAAAATQGATPLQPARLDVQAAAARGAAAQGLGGGHRGALALAHGPLVGSQLLLALW